MFKKLLGILCKEEKNDYKRLLALEINSYLNKIYGLMELNSKLRQIQITPSQIILKTVDPAALKMWEFKLNSKEQVNKGDIGSVIIATQGITENVARKQRALFIASELYIYFAFAACKNKKYFESIKGQNHSIDFIKSIFKLKNSQDLRAHGVRYIVEEIGEHKLANSRPKGCFVAFAKLNEHNSELAKILGSSKETFVKLFKKTNQKFEEQMILQEKDLLRKELEDINHLINNLNIYSAEKRQKHKQQIALKHINNLEQIKKHLKDILNNLKNWSVVKKAEHETIKKRKLIPTTDLTKLLSNEAKSVKVDINKIYILFDKFKNEKINILRDLELMTR